MREGCHSPGSDRTSPISLVLLLGYLVSSAWLNTGFSLVLDAGLGSGHRDFRALRVRGFPGTLSASRIWAGDDLGASLQFDRAYLKLLQSGRDPCGVTTLATEVGAPCVGCYAAARRRSKSRPQSATDCRARASHADSSTLAIRTLVDMRRGVASLVSIRREFLNVIGEQFDRHFETATRSPCGPVFDWQRGRIEAIAEI